MSIAQSSVPGARSDEPVPQRLPVTLLSGFLGSGKTTVLSHLLLHEQMRDAAVVINEFGEIALDHLLVAATVDAQTVLLDGGCVCCAVREDLAEALLALHARRTALDVPAFNRVVIETSGLADPTAIAALLLRDKALAARFELDAVVVTVDALHAGAQLGTQPEAIRQVMTADCLLLTKTDLVDTAEYAALCARLGALNPAAPQWPCTHGEIAPSAIIGQRARGDAVLDVTRWHAAATTQEQKGHECAHCAPDQHGFTLEHVVHGHGASAHCIYTDEPLDWAVLSSWLGSVAFHYGDKLLRLKAIANVRGEPQPIAVHGMQRWLHEPHALPCWPSGDRRSRFVFIVRDLPRSALTDALDTALRNGG